MRHNAGVTRRSFLNGGRRTPHYISSAVVVALPAHREALGRRLGAMPGVEVHASNGSRIVVTIDGPSSGMLGETLTTISAIEGVISANMVFEHFE